MTLRIPPTLPLYDHLIGEVGLQHALALKGEPRLQSSRDLVIARMQAAYRIAVGGEC